MRAAVYVRQSLSLQEGIERQRQRCAQLVTVRDWELVGVYVDDDVSASKTRGPKTAWHQLIRDAESHRVDAVVAVDLDRLIRSQRDLLTLIDLGLKVVTVDGDVDLTTADGTFRATMTTALARFEMQRKSERQMRAIEHRRSLGMPPEGRRAFGYTSSIDGHVPLEPEASAVRRAFMLAMTVSLTSIASEWNAAGLTNTSGGRWSSATLRVILSKPRYAAQVTPPPRGQGSSLERYDRSLFTPGTWEPLVSYETWLAVNLYLTRVNAKPITDSRTWLLVSGYATCQRCGGVLHSGVVKGGIRSYRCSSGSCTTKRAAVVDEFLSELIVARLSSRDVLASVFDAVEPALEALRGDLIAANAGRRTLLSLVASGTLSGAEATPAFLKSSRTLARLESELDNAVARADGTLSPELVRARWDGLSIERRRAIVRLLLIVTIGSQRSGWGRFDASPDVTVMWKRHAR